MLAGGGTYSLLFNKTFTENPSGKYLIIKVDSQNAVNESNEGNNEIPKAI